MDATKVDPITTEIIRNSFISIAEDMNAALIRSAYSWIIYEALDCAVALIDADHTVLAHSSGLPLFLGNLEACVDYTEERFGRDAWQPGDAWVMNDSYIGGTHLNDVTVVAPIFVDDDLVGFAASRAHHMDIGAKDPGGTTDSTEIYQEGMRLEPIRLVEGGRLRDDVVQLMALNSRLPNQLVGDLKAQLSVGTIAERRYAELLKRYGRETVAAARDAIFKQTEQLDRDAVDRIPDGIYEAEGSLDGDGLSDTPCAVKVRIEVDGDRMRIDLTESGDAAAGPVNCGRSQAIASCRLAFKRMINPDQPVNGGSFAPLEVLVREGSLLAAQQPSPCWWYFTPLGLLIDLVTKALAPALPERAAGAHYGDSCITIFAGTDPRSGQFFVDLQAHVGGWGAWRGSDGESALINAVNSEVKDFPIEVVETKVPMRINRYGFRRDSGGAGEWRGGCGIVREYVLDAEQAVLTAWFERSRTPAWGIFGGGAGAPPRITINPGRDDERTLLKVSALPLSRGDVVRAETGGGGGCGPVEKRNPELVTLDVHDGIVSADAARERYGIDVRR